MAVIPAETAFLPLARIPVVVNKSFHPHRRVAALLWTVHSVTATCTNSVSDDLVKLTPQVRISGVIRFVVGVWSWSFPWGGGLGCSDLQLRTGGG